MWRTLCLPNWKGGAIRSCRNDRRNGGHYQTIRQYTHCLPNAEFLAAMLALCLRVELPMYADRCCQQRRQVNRAEPPLRGFRVQTWDRMRQKDGAGQQLRGGERALDKDKPKDMTVGQTIVGCLILIVLFILVVLTGAFCFNVGPFADQPEPTPIPSPTPMPSTPVPERHVLSVEEACESADELRNRLAAQSFGIGAAWALSQGTHSAS